ncbi:MAG: hypothetical protein PHP45_05175 [Elusimicrobiales bacterium]|nr:hypothetical protein [Elusimicrobiales bacterium]
MENSQPETKPSFKYRAIHAITGHPPPENAGTGDLARLVIHSPRAVAGTFCALLAVFFISQTALFLIDPYSPYILRPRRRGNEQARDNLLRPPAPNNRESVSLEYLQAAAQKTPIAGIYDVNNGAIREYSSLREEKRSGKKEAARPPSADAMVVPLFREETGAPLDSAGIAAVSSAAVSTQTGDVQSFRQEPVSSMKLPPPPSPSFGHRHIWAEMLLFSLAPFIFALISSRAKDPLSAELACRAAFLFALTLSFTGLMELATMSYPPEGAAGLVLGILQVKINARRMIACYGFVPKGLISRVKAGLRRRGWVK